MVEATPRAAIHTIPDSLDAIEECYRRGWTDGLPVVPPTADRVQAMLEGVGLEPGHVLGEVPVRRRALTAEQAAANAVMAGCLPAYFPVVLATMRVLFEHDPNCIHEVFRRYQFHRPDGCRQWPDPARDRAELHRQPVESRQSRQLNDWAGDPFDLNQRVRAAARLAGPGVYGQLNQIRRGFRRG